MIGFAHSPQLKILLGLLASAGGAMIIHAGFVWIGIVILFFAAQYVGAHHGYESCISMPCSCGSKQPFKDCCIGKGLDDDD